MFTALKVEIESLLNVKTYPLLGPQSESEFVTLQRISDPPLESGIIRTYLIAVRYQICFISPRYERTEDMDRMLWFVWQKVIHGSIAGHPVQYIKREGLSESYSPEDDGRYRRARDYIFYCPEGAA